MLSCAMLESWPQRAIGRFYNLGPRLIHRIPRTSHSRNCRCPAPKEQGFQWFQLRPPAELSKFFLCRWSRLHSQAFAWSSLSILTNSERTQKALQSLPSRAPRSHVSGQSQFPPLGGYECSQSPVGSSPPQMHNN